MMRVNLRSGSCWQLKINTRFMYMQTLFWEVILYARMSKRTRHRSEFAESLPFNFRE